jgi:hypothetical protein
MTGGSHLSLAEEVEGHTPSGFNPVGCGLLPDLGRNSSPRPFSIFHFFSSFSFSVFLFLLYLLQKGFNSIQTTFRNFLKINAMI